jgi:hypothetical protein
MAGFKDIGRAAYLVLAVAAFAALSAPHRRLCPAGAAREGYSSAAQDARFASV